MRKKQILSSVFAVLIASSMLTACAESASQTESSSGQPAEARSGSTALEPVYEINGWTMEEFVADMELCGQKIPFPCKVSEMGADFTVANMPVFVKSDNTTGDDLLYKGERVATIYLNGRVEKNTDESEITGLFLTRNDRSGDLAEFNFMGITDKSTPEEVKEKLGEPTTTGSASYNYIFSDKKQIGMMFDEDGKMLIFFVNYEPADSSVV